MLHGNSQVRMWGLTSGRHDWAPIYHVQVVGNKNELTIAVQQENKTHCLQTYFFPSGGKRNGFDLSFLRLHTFKILCHVQN